MSGANDHGGLVPLTPQDADLMLTAFEAGVGIGIFAAILMAFAVFAWAMGRGTGNAKPFDLEPRYPSEKRVMIRAHSRSEGKTE